VWKQERAAVDAVAALCMKRYYRSGPIKSELYLMFVIKESWKKKVQEVKLWSNFTNGVNGDQKARKYGGRCWKSDLRWR
jgi:hypothetical protein